MEKERNRNLISTARRLAFNNPKKRQGSIHYHEVLGSAKRWEIIIVLLVDRWRWLFGEHLFTGRGLIVWRCGLGWSITEWILILRFRCMIDWRG